MNRQVAVRGIQLKMSELLVCRRGRNWKQGAADGKSLDSGHARQRANAPLTSLSPVWAVSLLSFFFILHHPPVAFSLFIVDLLSLCCFLMEIKHSACRKRKLETSQQLLRETGFESRDLPTRYFSDLGNRLSTLANDDREFLIIKEKFTSALGSLAKHTTVVGIHRCTFEGTSAQVRLETFQRQEQAVGAARGNANVRYAWHGTSKKGVLGIIFYGFGQPGVPKHGANYGSGVYLAPEGKSFLSAIYSDVDEDGSQHMLLCKVILGEMEQALQGSKQFSPSSEDHDTGADDVASPSRYIVWSTHMNTHILPLFVVSFKLAPSLRDLVMARNIREDASRSHCLYSQPSSSVQDREEARVSKKVCDAADEASQNGVVDNAPPSGLGKAPQSPWISFPDLFLRMGKDLSPFALMTLQQLHCEFQVGRLPRKSLVRLIRAMAGDTILWQCITGKTMDVPSELSDCGEGRDGT